MKASYAAHISQSIVDKIGLLYTALILSNGCSAQG